MVKVSGDAAGNIIVPSANPEYGFIRVEETRNLIDDRGFLRSQKLSALIIGMKNDLKNLGWKAGQEIPGKIVVKESLVPFNKKEPERDYKVAGKTQIVCCVGSDPIYRKTFYVQNENMGDVLLEHTNKEQIVAAYEDLLNELTENTISNLDSSDEAL